MHKRPPVAVQPTLNTTISMDHTLSLTSNFTRIETEYQRPYQITSFSLNELRKIEFNDSALRYLVGPPQTVDLNYRYEHWIKHPEERTRLDNLLQACLRKEAKRERKRANVITWRGIMTKIFIAPYERWNGWTLNVMLVGDTLYLEEHLEPAQIKAKENMDEESRRMTYYGYAFESFCTQSGRDASQTSDGWGGDVNTNIQWCSVVKTKLNDLRIIIGGEVDCVRDQYVGQPDTFVELKTSVEIPSGQHNDGKRWEKKLLRFFTQSFLLGVPEIVVGFRDRRGLLKNTVSLQTASIPRTVRNNSRQWNPQTCQAWAYATLKHMRDVVQTNYSSPKEVWRAVFEPCEGIKLRRLSTDEISSSVACGEDRIGFLPRTYWEAVVSS